LLTLELRITAHMLQQIFRATVEHWQQCFETGGHHIQLYYKYLYI